MSQSSCTTTRSLEKLPFEIQNLIYQYCYSSPWSFHVHPTYLEVRKSGSSRQKSKAPAQNSSSTSCTNPHHPRNPSRALLLTCRAIRKIAQPLLYSMYGGTISICADTFMQYESYMPDIYVPHLMSIFQRNDFLRSHTCTLSMDLSHIQTQFADYLWFELQQEPDRFVLPSLKEIILKDNVYYETSHDYMPGGNWYNILPDSHQEHLSSSGASCIFQKLSRDLAQYRFDELFGYGWDFQHNMEHAPHEDLLRWIPRETPVDAEDVRGLNNIPTYYLPRFRIDGMDEQAYEVRFRLEKRDPYFDVGINPLFGWIRKFSFLEGRILTPEEDTKIDWWEAAGVGYFYPYDYDGYRTSPEDSILYRELAPFEGGRKSRGEYIDLKGMSLQGT